MSQQHRSNRPRNSSHAAHDLILDDFGFTMARALHVPPMAGRIWAELILTPEPCLSLAQIRQAVGASAGSSSEMTRLLLDEGVIERVVLPGDRKDYFRLTDNLLESCTASAVNSNRMVRELFERNLARLGRAQSGPRAIMSEMAAFYLFIEKEIPQMYQRFQGQRQASGRRAGS